MGRDKNKRTINFKPKYKTYIPEQEKISGITNIQDDEIEAIYLMDVLGLYQEDAAKSMGVSRPTFTRIIKNARKKLSTAIISGHKINIQDNKEYYNIAYCSKNKDIFKDILPTNEYIFTYKVFENNITLKEKIENPVYNNNEKPAILLPEIFVKHNVDYFISEKIGIGLQNSLLSKGITPLVKEIKNIDDLIIDI
ncbi:MAG: DUF134 domain-containing protein [Campylobacterota bacterium]|nr:DUF134 domain-containing protein [Campylobacterota bacterium]